MDSVNCLNYKFLIFFLVFFQAKIFRIELGPCLVTSVALYQPGQGLCGAAKQPPPVRDVGLASVVQVQEKSAFSLIGLLQGDPEGYLVGR